MTHLTSSRQSKFMFSRTNKSPTIELPFYNSPPLPQHLRRNVRPRYMAFGLVTFLACITVFSFGRATPFVQKNSTQLETSLTRMQNEATYQNNIEAITEIYHGRMEVFQENINHLIIVAGHAILLDKSKYMNDEAWVLESFQKGGQVTTFIEHILKGVELAKNDDRSLLVFSGSDVGRFWLNCSGQTRPLAGPRSEGQSYWNLASHLYQHDKSMEKFLLQRVISEEFARDSYENVLFSLCRFYEMTGRYPEKITVVGFGFKERRFRDLHRKAVRFPKDRFTYIGIDPLNANIKELAQLETANAEVYFENDPYACSSPVLAGKRLLRNPFRRMHGYGKTNPALLDLLSWCPESGSTTRWFDKKSLPWDRSDF